MSISELTDILSLTIKYDDENKVILFFVMLSAYTKENQLNLHMLGPSASGKTYQVLETSRYYPPNDILWFDAISPNAFKYYNLSIDKETGLTCCNIERRIIVFSEMPHQELLKNLRPVLSHDNKYCRFVTTNKKSGRNEVDDVYIKGYAATVFCSANTSNIDTQEANRAILISPEVTSEKINASLNLVQIKSSDKDSYNNFVNSNEKRKSLMRRIRHIKNMNIQYIKISSEDSKLVLKKFKQFIGENPASRSTRDLDHLYSIIKATALLNAENRVNDKGDVIVNKNDIDSGFKLWEKVGIPQLYGITPYLYEDVYEKVIVPAWLEQKNNARLNDVIGLTRNDIEEKFTKVHKRMLRSDELRKNIIRPLTSCGLISEDVHPEDKKYKIITPNVINGKRVNETNRLKQMDAKKYSNALQEVLNEKALK